MFGKAKEHLKIILVKLNGGVIVAITFFAPEKLLEQVEGKKTLSLVGVV